jgi:hypothetical protein
VRTPDSGVEFTAVLQADPDAFRSVDDVKVGHDVTLGPDDHARTLALNRLGILFGSAGRQEPAETAHLLDFFRIGFLRDRDDHHGRRDRLGDFNKRLVQQAGHLEGFAVPGERWCRRCRGDTRDGDGGQNVSGGFHAEQPSRAAHLGN